MIGLVLVVPMVQSLNRSPGLLAATVSAGNHVLLPNQAGQRIEIRVTGSDQIAGVDLFMQVGDGGRSLAQFGLPPGRPGPAIRSVDLKKDTIFRDLSDLPVNLSDPRVPQVHISTLALVGGAKNVLADGRLAEVEVDTTGFFGGEWSLRLSDVLPFDVFAGPFETTLIGAATDLVAGKLTIPVTRGDYDGDLTLDLQDIDLLAKTIRAGTNDLSLYDLNDDRAVNGADYEFWRQFYGHLVSGDANGDGQFTSSDLVDVFVAGQYEDALPGNSLWQTGDWTGDGEFTSSDLVVAFQEGAYELGSQSNPAVAVPEPNAIAWIIVAASALGWRMTRAQRGDLSRVNRSKREA